MIVVDPIADKVSTETTIGGYDIVWLPPTPDPLKVIFLFLS